MPPGIAFPDGARSRALPTDNLLARGREAPLVGQIWQPRPRLFKIQKYTSSAELISSWYLPPPVSNPARQMRRPAPSDAPILGYSRIKSRSPTSAQVDRNP